MIRWHYYILLLICFQSNTVFAQTGCTVPLPPVLQSVSVKPETELTDLNWSLSPSTDIAAYIVYTYKDPDGLPVDTIWNPAATSYSLTSTGTKYFSISYVVTAYRVSTVSGEEGCASPLSNVLQTIFCSTTIDTCNRRVTVNWNKYSDYPKPVKEYVILVSINGSPLTEMYSAGKDSESFTISDFNTDAQYCMAVKAIFNDGTYSSSNKSCLSTKMQRPPNWINADYATVNDENKISLSFSVDPSSEIRNFSLERKTGITGTFKEIARPVFGTNRILYTDNEAKTAEINYYRLSAINSCNIPVTVSNLCSNVVLTLERSGDDLILGWNAYKKWLGDMSDYRLYINTGNGFEERQVISVYDTLITLGYKEIMYEVSSGKVCFFIKTTESSNPFGVTGETNSSVICTNPTEVITVPNVFTPDNDLVNDYFKPVLSFSPQDYNLVITDKNGRLLFETRDEMEEWDGTFNGTPQPQGLFLWFLKITTPSSETISKTGTVTIIRNR